MFVDNIDEFDVAWLLVRLQLELGYILVRCLSQSVEGKRPSRGVTDQTLVSSAAGKSLMPGLSVILPSK